MAVNDLIRRGSKRLARDINNSRVLQVIQARAPVSRAEIAKVAELPPPTVTAIINDFIRAGLVRETDQVRDADDGAVPVGRRPIMLVLNESAAFAAGVKLRPDGMTVAITDLGGNTIYHRAVALLPPRAELGGSAPAAVLQQVADEIRAGMAEADVHPAQTIGVGVGMPGLIDHVSGVCRHSSFLGWENVRVREDLERILELPVYVDNDVNMVTAAELAFGAGREASEFLTVTIGRGIGLGIVMRGEIYRGTFGGAGEFGHVKTESPLRCECGSVGCLEAVASETGICAQVASELGLPEATIDEALRLAHQGDPRVRAIFARAGDMLGREIGNLLNLFNPQLVIVTGEGTRTGGVLLDPMRIACTRAAFAQLGTDARIVVQEWGDEAWARGAASIAVHEMLRPPIYQSTTAGPLDQLLDRVPMAARGRS
jgi:predicted NBD/HSP70 family sugar kinase